MHRPRGALSLLGLVAVLGGCHGDRVNREMMKEYSSCLLWVLVLLVCFLMIVFANQVLGWVDDVIG